MQKRKKIILIGCGRHYQKVYHEVLEENAIEIALLIDLQSNKEWILNFFQDKRVKPVATIFLEEKFRNVISIEEIEAIAEPLTDLDLIDAVIISTEPKVRKPYTIWSAQHGFAVFMDKPVSAFSHPAQVDRLLSNYDEIMEIASENTVDIVVCCERRAHLGYSFVKNYLKQFIEETAVPITSIDIHFAGGVWCLPNEYFSKESHPYKYGYGLLLHSGYHYIDLLASLFSLNGDDLSDCSLKVITSGLLDQVRPNLISSEHRECQIEPDRHVGNCGETDVLVIGQSHHPVRTNFSLKLINNSVSLRQQEANSSNIEGRIRQEHVVIHLSHLCSIHISSYPFNKIDPSQHPDEHFNVTIMNSPLIKDKKSIIRLTRADFADLFPAIAQKSSMNKHARKWQLKEFFSGRDGHSSIQSHRNTVRLLHAIYSTFKA